MGGCCFSVEKTKKINTVNDPSAERLETQMNDIKSEIKADFNLQGQGAGGAKTVHPMNHLNDGERIQDHYKMGRVEHSAGFVEIRKCENKKTKQ